MAYNGFGSNHAIPWHFHLFYPERNLFPVSTTKVSLVVTVEKTPVTWPDIYLYLFFYLLYLLVWFGLVVSASGFFMS